MQQKNKFIGLFGLFLEVLIVLRFSQKPRIIHKDRTKIIVMLMCHRQIYYLVRQRQYSWLSNRRR